MVEAAANELLNYDPEFDSPVGAASRILSAALGGKVVSLHEVNHIGTNLLDAFGDSGKPISRNWFVDHS